MFSAFFTLSVILTIPSLAIAQSGTWATKASAPTARRDAAAASIAAFIYVVGGDSGGLGLQTLEVYDTATDTWTTMAPMPTPRNFLTASVVNGILYAIGGQDYPQGTLTTVEAYDPTSDTWTLKAPMPTARRQADAGVVNGIIYVVGGYDGISIASTTVEAYDPVANTWSTKAPMPEAHYIGGVGVVNGILYVLGGSNGSAGQSYNPYVYAYNPATNTWATKSGLMPTPRDFLGAGVINNKIYAVGGLANSATNTNYISAALEAYDPVTDTWTIEPAMPTGRFQLAAAVSNGVLYSIDGLAISNVNTLMSTNEAYTPTSDPATQITNLIAYLQNLNLQQGGTSNSLTSKLQNALSGLGSGSPSSCNLLDAFINQTQALSGKQLTISQATGLIANANQIKAAAGCP
jgi:N-acetylneuraminic acid mutarotase